MSLIQQGPPRKSGARANAVDMQTKRSQVTTGCPKGEKGGGKGSGKSPGVPAKPVGPPPPARGPPGPKAKPLIHLMKGPGRNPVRKASPPSLPKGTPSVLPSQTMARLRPRDARGGIAVLTRVMLPWWPSTERQRQRKVVEKARPLEDMVECPFQPDYRTAGGQQDLPPKLSGSWWKDVGGA